jgi:hypothetical protein
VESNNPRGEYKPSIGSSFSGEREETPISESYADLDSLREDLLTLIREARHLEDILEEEMNHYALPVSNADLKLYEAHVKEWPSRLGEPSDQISYRYYKALRLRNTTSANYIRTRYEEAARDVTGTTAIDLLIIAGIVKNEALLVQEFLDAHIGNVDDSSEFRLLELFQDWVQTALLKIRQFWQVFTEREEAAELLPKSEVERVTREEATQAQAVFKAKLNSHNQNIVQNIEYLKKNFSDNSSVFYNKFLGPALDYRLKVGRRTLPTGSRLSQVIEDASLTLDGNLRGALADQMRRDSIFASKLFQIEDDIHHRDIYRGYIRQLAVKGKPAPRVMEPAKDNHNDVQFWHNEEKNAEILPGQDEGTFRASHDVLQDTELDNAHPQYLLKSGGTMEGHLDLENGVLVDGMKPSTHRHTGKDGTLQIDGKDILGGSLIDDVVDADAIPGRPTNLRVINYRRSPDSPTIEATLAWDGDQRFTYEVQIAPAELRDTFARPS